MPPIKPIFFLNGPNLNMLGDREPGIYGRHTLEDIETRLVEYAKKAGVSLTFRQSNHEGVLVDWIQEAKRDASALIINAGAYTHTSIALLDALRLLNIPIIEVHLSNIFSRESFRHHSYISPVATGVICGFGVEGYGLALSAALALISATPQEIISQSFQAIRGTDV